MRVPEQHGGPLRGQVAVSTGKYPGLQKVRMTSFTLGVRLVLRCLCKGRREVSRKGADIHSIPERRLNHADVCGGEAADLLFHAVADEGWQGHGDDKRG